MAVMGSFLTLKISLEHSESVLVDVKAMNEGSAHHNSSKGENTTATTKVCHCPAL